MSSVQSCSEEARSPRRCRRQRTVVTIFQLKNKYFDEKIYIILEKRCYIRFCFPFAFLSFCLCFRRKVPILSSFFSFFSFLVGLREGPRGLVDRGVRSKYFKLKIGQLGQKASCILNLVLSCCCCEGTWNIIYRQTLVRIIFLPDAPFASKLPSLLSNIGISRRNLQSSKCFWVKHCHLY